MLFGFACPNCGIEDCEVDIVVDYAGSPGSYSGPYESSYPGEGAEWHIGDEPDPRCDCGLEFTNELISEKFEDEIQQMIAEPPEPYGADDAFDTRGEGPYYPDIHDV